MGDDIFQILPKLEVGYVQSIYDRIVKPELSREDTRSYLRRLERLKKSCQNELQTYIHYPSVEQQLATGTLASYVVRKGIIDGAVVVQRQQADGTFMDIANGNQLGSDKIIMIQQKRADAVIVFTNNACRVNKFDSIAEQHREILFVLAQSRDVAVAALNHVMASWKTDPKAIFAEVPESWDAFFMSAGFKQHPYEAFGTLLPKHSFLHTWVLGGYQDLKRVNEIFEVASEKDMIFPADPEITDVKQPKTQSGLLINVDAYPNDTIKANARFLNDYTTILNFARSSNGQIELDDADTARITLQRMFGFARMVDKQETWRHMIEVERAFADFGLFTTPSTQSLYLELAQRNNVSEMLANLWVMRSFASAFPRFASQQIALEVNTLQPKMSHDARMRSRKWIVANLSQPNDFGALNPFSFETLKAIHARMLTLRQSWKDRVGGLARSIAILEGEIPVGSKTDPDVAPIVALQKKTADIIQNAKDVEAQFQRTLTSTRNELKEKSHTLSVQDWITESQTSAQTLQTFAFDPSTLASNSVVAPIPAEKATALVANIVAESQRQQAAQASGETVVGGVTLQTASPDNDALDKLMATFNDNLKKLKDMEVARKKEIREKMTKLAAEALGSKAELQKLAQVNHPDLSASMQDERQNILKLAQGCDMLLQSSILNPIFKANDDPIKESQTSEVELTQLHNILVSQRDCLERYYKSMQMLENRIVVEAGENGIAATRDTLQTLLGYERKADTAISEGKLVIEKAKSADFRANIEVLEKDIAQMNLKRGVLMQQHQELESLLQKLPNPESMAKAQRVSLLTVAKNTLDDIVRILLGLRQKWLVSTEQFKLLSAIQTNSKNLDAAVKEAQSSARIAAERQKQLEIEQATNNALGERLTVLTSNDRHTTASFSNLQAKAKSFKQNHQIALMQLAQKLQMDVENSKTPAHTIHADIRNIDEYLKKHSDALDADDFSGEKAQILDAVSEAKRLLDSGEHQQRQLERNDKQMRMLKVKKLMDELQDAVDDENADDIRFLSSELRALDFRSVYTIDEDTRELLKQARYIAESDDRRRRKQIAY